MAGVRAPSVEQLVDQLKLKPHPEGGFFAETFRDERILLQKDVLPPSFKSARSVSTAILFLLPSGSVSHLHRIPSSEVWHFYQGSPLTVFELYPDGSHAFTRLGPASPAEQSRGEGGAVEGLRVARYQHVVPPGVWFGAFPTHDFDGEGARVTHRKEQEGGEEGKDASHAPYSLAGCTVSPGFSFEDFDLLAQYPPSLAPWIRALSIDLKE